MTNEALNTNNPDFRARIDAITARSLAPENIHTYADDALDGLIDVVAEITAGYDEQMPGAPAGAPTGAEHERAAMQHFGLDGDEIEETLDRIGALSAEIAGLDSVIEEITVHANVMITPPDPTDTAPIAPGGQPMQVTLVPRLKTLLFILAKKFDVNLRDREECLVERGNIPAAHMRTESYRLVTVPTLNRTILVCDERGNATFVFDTERLAEIGVDHEAVKSLTKDDIRDMLELYPGAGRRLTYSDTFTEEVSSLLEVIPAPAEEIQIHAGSGQILKGRRGPANMHRVWHMVKEFGSTQGTVHVAIAAVSEQLGDIGAYEGHPIYTEGQKTIIQAWMEANGHLSEKPTKDERSIQGIADELSINSDIVREAIADIGAGLGPPRRARGGITVYGSSQRAQIRTWLIAHNRIDENTGSLSYPEFAGIIGLSANMLKQITARNVARLGEVKFVGKTYRISLLQQDILLQILDEEGYLVPEQPEGYLSVTQYANATGYAKSSVNRALVANAEALGEVGNYLIGLPTRAGKHSGRKRGKAYSPAQQDILGAWLAENATIRTPRAIGAAAAGEVTVELGDSE
jgi:hypothetical protein